MKNIVKDNIYYNNYGEPISFGSKIKMGFAGEPVDMIKPFILVSAENVFSTVSYRNEVKIIVSGSNGVKHDFYFARYYNPIPNI